VLRASSDLFGQVRLGEFGADLVWTDAIDMAAALKVAVADGDYASTSEVVREAIRDWKLKRALQIQELAALKADIDKGLADVAAGRIKAFDKENIIARGRLLLAGRKPAA